MAGQCKWRYGLPYKYWFLLCHTCEVEWALWMEESEAPPVNEDGRSLLQRPVPAPIPH